ncbi:hypothetical protein LI177_09690 [bacterium 210820-DFI.6.37]|nr:hypothetical protein [bacterium 210820-DFI.6.37]
MKQNLNYILYGVALIIILIPIALEQTGKAVGQPAETILLSCGVLLLVLGKICSIIKKKRAEDVPGTSVFQDVIIIACLLAMLIWMIIKG